MLVPLFWVNSDVTNNLCRALLVLVARTPDGPPCGEERQSNVTEKEFLAVNQNRRKQQDLIKELIAALDDYALGLGWPWDIWAMAIYIGINRGFDQLGLGK